LYSVFQRTVKYKLVIRRLIARMWSTTRRQQSAKLTAKAL